MAETTADVRRDIELTRERMSSTLAELERKLNLMEVVREHPWPSLAIAIGAGVLLGSSGADVKTAAATARATRDAGGKVGGMLDGLMATLLAGVHNAVEERMTDWADDLKGAIAPGRRSRGLPPRAD